MGTWEPGVAYTDPTPDQITEEVIEDREEQAAAEEVVPLPDLPAATVPLDATDSAVVVQAGVAGLATIGALVNQTNTTATLTVGSVIAASGTASDGHVQAAASNLFFGGGIIGVRAATGSTTFRTNVNVNGLGIGDGTNAPDVKFERTGANAATITVTTLTLAGNLSMSARSIITDTTTGLKIGTGTTQKLGFWNKTPVAQPTTAITGAAFAANSGTAVNDASTFGGYTLAKIAAALINTGILA